jgi:hypothetical protein
VCSSDLSPKNQIKTSISIDSLFLTIIERESGAIGPTRRPTHENEICLFDRPPSSWGMCPRRARF